MIRRHRAGSREWLHNPPSHGAPTRSNSSLGGPGYLKALRAPSPEAPFVPVGGVDAQAARDYLARGALAVGVGSPLVGDAADGGDLDQLRTRAAQFRKVAAGESP